MMQLDEERGQGLRDAQTRGLLAKNAPGVVADVRRADDLDERCLDFLERRAEEYPSVRPTALDIATGDGKQALRMAQHGAMVTAVDVHDRARTLADAARRWRITRPPVFCRVDMQALSEDLPGAPYDAIVCQRAIHYLPYVEALAALRQWPRFLKSGGRLYISAYGLRSVFANGYPDLGRPVEKRFAALSWETAERYGVRAPVCLYDTVDLIDLLHRAGFGVAETFVSDTGNVKAVAFV